MKKAGYQIFLMALAFTLLSLPGLAFALDGKYEAETLRGIKALHVIIKGFESEIEQYGLTREKIQNELETKLGMAGIKVLSKEECLKEQGSPYLTLMVGTLRAFTTRDTEFYFFSIVINLRQGVYLERKPETLVGGITTWSNTRFGINFAQNIRSEINDATDQFFKAYTAANAE
jgi:hypothetical protein